MKDIQIRNKTKNSRDQARSANASKHKIRRKRKYHFYYILLVFFLLIVGVILSVTVFFNIETINIEGASHYNHQDIIDAGNLRTGQNLLRLNITKIQDEIISKLEYCDKVTIKRELPVTLTITISEASPELSIEKDGRYLYVSHYGRILNVNETEIAPNTIHVVGMQSGEYVKGQFMDDENEKHKLLSDLRSLLAQYELTDITKIDLSNLSDIVIRYDDRVNINVGTISDLDYKIRAAQHIVQEELSVMDRGDLQFVLSTKNYHFIPEHNLTDQNGESDTGGQNSEDNHGTNTEE